MIHPLFTQLIITILNVLSKSSLRLIVKYKKKKQESLVDLLCYQLWTISVNLSPFEFVSISECLLYTNMYLEDNSLGLEWCRTLLHLDLRELTLMSKETVSQGSLVINNWNYLIQAKKEFKSGRYGWKAYRNQPWKRNRDQEINYLIIWNKWTLTICLSYLLFLLPFVLVFKT